MRPTHPGTQKKSVQVDKQVMLHEAQIIDSYRRIMNGINGTVMAIEQRNIPNINREKNNLAIQIETASFIIHDKKFKGMHNEKLKELAADFAESLGGIPEGCSKELEYYVDKILKIFYGPLNEQLEMHGENKDMTTEDMQQMMFALNYSGMMGDQQQASLDKAKCSEDLTMFKESRSDPMNGGTYMKDYTMVSEHENVFQSNAHYKPNP